LRCCDVDRSGSWRHLFCYVNLPRHEPDYAKTNDNPRSSIHNDKSSLSGYSAEPGPTVKLDSRCSTPTAAGKFNAKFLPLGTGSNPHPPQGWHRARRFNPSQLPRLIPWVSTASRKYAEHVGVNRQPESGPHNRLSSGENVH
jgi:hypothetical protein